MSTKHTLGFEIPKHSICINTRCLILFLVHPPFCDFLTHRRRARPKDCLLVHPGKTCTSHVVSMHPPLCNFSLPGEDMHLTYFTLFILFFLFHFLFFFLFLIFFLFFYFVVQILKIELLAQILFGISQISMIRKGFIYFSTFQSERNIKVQLM